MKEFKTSVVTLACLISLAASSFTAAAMAIEDDINSNLSGILDLDNDFARDTKFAVVAFIKTARFERALQLLKPGGKIKDPERLLLYILCSVPAANFDSAVLECKAWLSRNPQASRSSKAFVHAVIGDLLRRKSDLRGAIAEYNIAETLSDSDGSANELSRQTQLLLDVKERRITPDDYIKISQTGRMSKTDAALGDLLLALATSSKTPLYDAPPSAGAKTLFEQAQSLENQGHFDKALSLYRKANECHPNNFAIKTALANCAFTAETISGNSSDDVRKQYEAITQKFPDQWKAWNNLGVAMYIRDDLSLANKSLRKAASFENIPQQRREAIKETLSMCSSINMLKRHYEPHTAK